jgi:ribosome-associated protein
MLEVNHQISIPLDEFTFTFSRSSGPGGQNVNKVNTKVTLRWPLEKSSLPAAVKQRFREQYPRRINQAGELLVMSQRFRDQGRNVADCLSKLRAMVLAVATPPRQRKATRPTGASRRRRIEDKRRTGDKKQTRRPPKLDD